MIIINYNKLRIQYIIIYNISKHGIIKKYLVFCMIDYHIKSDG